MYIQCPLDGRVLHQTGPGVSKYRVNAASGNVGCWNGGPSVGRTREGVTLPCEDVERKN